MRKKKQKKTSIKPFFSDISVEKALLRAKKENKKVLIYLKKRNDYASRWIENQIFSNEGIQKALSDHYIGVVANLNTHRGVKRDRKYGMKYFPSVIKLNEKGESIEEINTNITQEDFLNFLMKNENQPLEDKPFTLEIPEEKNTKMRKRQSLSLSMGVGNSQISDFSSKIRTAVSTDLLYSVDYDKKYLWRTGLRFAPKGDYHLPINYLQIPLELGWTAYETNLFDVEMRVRLLASPYYALRLSGKSSGVSTNDYGINFGIAPEMGTISKLSLLFYYEHGGKDILKQVSGFQRNQSFGVRAILTF